MERGKTREVRRTGKGAGRAQSTKNVAEGRIRKRAESGTNGEKRGKEARPARRPESTDRAKTATDGPIQQEYVQVLLTHWKIYVKVRSV